MSESVLSTDAPPERKGRRWVFVTLLVLLPLGLLAGGYVYLSLAADADLRDAMAEASHLEPDGWRLFELETHREAPEPDQNSAFRVLAVKQTLPGGWGTAPAFYELFEDLLPEAQLNEPQVAALHAELAKASQALEPARQLAEMPQGRYVVQWAPNPLDSILPAQEARGIADLLRYDAMRRSQEGDADGAVRSGRAILNASRSVGDEPTGISQLIRISVRAVARGSLERTLAQGEPSPEALAGLQQALTEDEREPLLLFAARGERATSFEAMEDLRTTGRAAVGPFGPLWDSAGFMKHQQAAVLRFTSRLTEIARLPEEEQTEPLQALEAESDHLPLMAALLAPAVMKVAAACRRSRAEVRCAVCAVAAERYRRQQGRWPESLDALVQADLLRVVPADPYDAAPLRFARLGDGVVIYALGPDGQDDGGTLNRKDATARGADLGFRLWDPERRRQPPLPPKPPPANGEDR